MQRIQTKLSSKSQVTLPSDVRDVLGVGPGDQILWMVDDSGNVSISAAPRLSVRGLRGIVPAIDRAMSDDFDAEIEEAMADLPVEERGFPATR